MASVIYLSKIFFYSAGIMFQSEKFPVRFIVELLNKQYRIVLTGKLMAQEPSWDTTEIISVTVLIIIYVL